jgi:hypothetical protein
MQARTGIGTIAATMLLACMPSSAAALGFVQSPGSPYPTTSPPFTPTSAQFLGGIASGDFNGDGVSDLAVVNATGLPVFSAGESVSVLLGSRSGTLMLAPDSPIEIYSGGIFSMTGAIAAGDFTGDGKLDLAVVDEINRTVSTLIGDGTGHFHPSGTPIPISGSGTASLAVGDFNGNGEQDLAVVDSELSVLLGKGSGGFTSAPGSPLPLSGSPTSSVAGDFDGDGHSDLAIANGSGYVTVYLSSPTGSFHASSTLTTDSQPQSIAAADLTGNGRLDLVTANAGSDDVTVLLGDGSGGFAPASGSPFSVSAGPNCRLGSQPGLPESVAAGDFAGNGKPDLAVANFNGCSNSVAVLQGDGTGQFTNATDSPFDANSNPRGMAVGDFDGDGKLDVAAVNPFLGAVTVLQNTTEEPEEPASTSPLPTPPSGDGGDLHHDGPRTKSAKCSRVVVHVHRGRKARNHGRKAKKHSRMTKKKHSTECSKRRKSSTHQDSGRRPSSKTHRRHHRA